MSNIIAHRGFWKQPNEQNTTEAILGAFFEGFDVEVDLRLSQEGNLVTGHDMPQEIDWEKVMSCPERRMISFHIKEKGLATKLWQLVEDMQYLDYIVFGVSPEEMQIYIDLFGYETVAFEYDAGDDYEKAFMCRNKVIWIAELGGKRVTTKELLLLKSQKKIIYVVTQDCHAGDQILFGIRLNQFYNGKIDGICSDNCDIVKYYV